MFHTPPTKDSWQTDTSVKFSYDAEQPDVLENTQQTALSSQSQSDKSPAIGSERRDSNEKILNSVQTISKDELPASLLKHLQDFIKSLREPRYAKPLATFEIAELFQRFYTDFSIRANDLTHSDKRVELKELDRPLNNPSYKYNLIVERLLCEKFYSSVMFPKKGVPIDEFEKKLNYDFGIKLAYLNSLDIKFENLDIHLDIDEESFVDNLHDRILPQFEIFTAERSPTLKLKHLSQIHAEIDKLIRELSKSTVSELNTDIYLPILIYILIKLEDLRTHALISQFEFIKRFRNDYIYDGIDDEKGQLLYVFTNFEASLSYLASVTLDNLNISLDESISKVPEETRELFIKFLTKPLVLESIEEEIKKIRPLSTPSRQPSSLLDSSRFSLLAPSEFLPLYHADQGIRNISNAVDSSIKSIIGRVSWLNSIGATDNHDPILESTRQQMEENLAIQSTVSLPKVEESKITPTSSISTSDSRHHVHTGSDVSLQLSSHLDQSETGEDMGASTITSSTLVRTRSQTDSIVSSPNAQDKFINKFTSSMSGVMKNFRPVSASSSSSSLNVHLEPNASSNGASQNTISPFNTGSNSQSGDKNKPSLNKMRSRTTSLINTGLFNQEYSKMGKAGLLNSIENAFENVKNRSRGSSLSDHLQNRSEDHQKLASIDISKLDRFGNKPFEQLSVSELSQMYQNYQYILSMLNKLDN
ncbi:hypothetical protein KL933_002722 [Ogataea haglerorum]|uniref:VPS9 domain-containing protein n=1 Tax=Ogataea haglerorum TaxID=1937702 RepID=A0AAN6D4V0_9ASCO|nr:hypothetical protein KL933_002722 [Ogataea haglerorum]